jgi:hypothetical protein
MALSYILHKGKKIMYIDYSKCKNLDEMLAVLDSAKKEYEKTTESYLTINDFSNTFGSKDFMNKAKELGPVIFDKRTIKSAIIGVTGIKRILLQAYNTVVKNKQVPFDTKDEALEYLVK